jgi:hypothetical protein
MKQKPTNEGETMKNEAHKKLNDAYKELIAWMETYRGEYDLDEIACYAVQNGIETTRNPIENWEDVIDSAVNALPDCVLSVYPASKDFDRVVNKINAKAEKLTGTFVI